MSAAAARHFLRIADLSSAELRGIVESAVRLKQVPRRAQLDMLKGQTMAMIFEKPSLRTHVSFETGMTQLGGHAIYLGPDNIGDLGSGSREPIKDVSRVLSSMVDITSTLLLLHCVYFTPCPFPVILRYPIETKKLELRNG